MKYRIHCEIDIKNILDWTVGALRDIQIGYPQKRRNKDSYKIVFQDRKIPAPYDQLICQLLAEERHGETDPGHESLRRQSYARRVLDKFVMEFKQYKKPPASFRSKVLTPILVRQMLGITDSYSPSIAEAVRDSGHEEDERKAPITIATATELYLGADPTDVDLIPAYRYNSIFIPELRWFLAVKMGSIQESSAADYNSFLQHHDEFMEILGNSKYNAEVGTEDETPVLSVPEIVIIEACGLRNFYKQELEGVVRTKYICVFTKGH